MTIAIGSRVQLKSGGSIMEVFEILPDDRVACRWKNLAGGQLDDSFPCHSLNVIKQPGGYEKLIGRVRELETVKAGGQTFFKIARGLINARYVREFSLNEAGELTIDSESNHAVYSADWTPNEFQADGVDASESAAG